MFFFRRGDFEMVELFVQCYMIKNQDVVYIFRNQGSYEIKFCL